LANNVLLICALATILLGTLYPLILDVCGLGKISVGPPYFNAVFVPLMTPLLILMGIAPLCHWREMRGKLLATQLLYPFLLATGLCLLALLLTADQLSFSVALGVFLAFWITLATLKSVWLQFQQQGRKLFFSARPWGMVFAHIGIACCVIGITLVTHYQIARDVRMQPGDRITLNAYQFEFLGVTALQGPNYSGANGQFLVTKNNQFIGLLQPQKRFYPTQQVTLSEADIDAGLTRDLYVNLGDPLDNHAWGVRIYYKPFVRFIWLGGLLIALGGLLAIL
jgi:cytochrome c-type biogenesis protein CcmF